MLPKKSDGVIMKTATTHSARSGFTLVEVSLAVLVVGLGLLAVYSLFPSGLRSGEDALADTRAALFASVVMEGMRANASGIKVWNEWNDDATLARLCTSLDGVGSLIADGPNNQHTISDFPLGSSRPLRYSIKVDRPTIRGISAYLKVWGRTGKWYNDFYTEFTYGGR